jgi:hypothetical protein
MAAAGSGIGTPGGGYMSPRIMSPRISSPAHPSGGGGGGGNSERGGRGRGRGGGFGGGGGVRRDRQFIGQTIKITGGPYKGNVGIVKDATDSTARVELHSTCQTISVDRSHMRKSALPPRTARTLPTAAPLLLLTMAPTRQCTEREALRLPCTETRRLCMRVSTCYCIIFYTDSHQNILKTNSFPKSLTCASFFCF